MGHQKGSEGEYNEESSYEVLIPRRNGMNIAQICPRYHPNIGGVETRVKESSERLARRDYDVEVLTTDPKGEFPRNEVINNVRVRRFKSWAPSEAYYFSRDLNSYLMKNSKNYDVLHASSYHAFPAVYATLAKKENRLIVTPSFHGGGHTFFRNFLHLPYKFFLGKKIFEKADKIICLSKYEKVLLCSNFRLKKEKIVVIPNGVTTSEFKNLKKRKNIIGKKILCVSRLEKYKGIDYLIRALPRLNKNVYLEIVGAGPYRKALGKIIAELGLESRVRFYQNLPREELLQMYADADVFILLSQKEAFGNAVAEALASKTPCIVANTSALKEWVDNENCFGIDYPIYLDRLSKLINMAIGKEIKGIKLQDWDDIVKKLTEIYEFK